MATIKQAERTEFCPVLYRVTPKLVPAKFKKESPLFEGFHEPFWITVNQLTSDMYVSTRFTAHPSFRG